ncbi:hydroxymethylglutaryl-CoA lyase [Sulfobacillus thermosulfidooxidans]|uniref:hydroxymethylglutaryl-CoA lyase n=1 Tax=Sulfobacillus thermosulfidooxidans TaxID=28034 RepID=UPI00096B90E5|nr:hydroxymethylglutaryl-CoA lyase [Sulfobacillus thermosulfidooxidans]OLZ09890.1 hydroxymethylglutaryl-CoA lyase [Sulfobacillus thermosulfidooxidans]OLZ15804.1 hydroxymethylglutaryl-CoA lyase [Sulfobacillus thermosulfidooxidans]OLZ18349.1 hydroxymethylglutaryl-CoA lyase [Sulfobacillus thermosulfidooxidans]
MAWQWKEPEFVWFRDVSPRDGLQAEHVILNTEDKVRLVNQLAQAGVPRIEVTSFVSPKWLPQMADAEQVMTSIERKPGVVYSVLVPNPKGAERAIATKPDEMTVFVSASETHNQKNVHRSIHESLEGFHDICAMARPYGITVSAVIVTAFGCPYEGIVPLSSVLELAERLQDLGISEIALGDTVGVANPKQVAQMVQAFQQKLPGIQLALHFHDTRGTALANLLAAVGSGASRFETALGGIGGSPFSPGAGGNLSTEDSVYCLTEMGISTGIHLQQLLSTTQFLVEKLGHDVPSKVFHAGGKMIPVNAKN